MAPFMTTIEQTDFDGMPAWLLTAPGGQSALVAERGATLISWQPEAGRDVIDGYVNADELVGHVGNRSLVMAPWCGRVAGGTYRFEGTGYTVSDADTAGLGGRVADVDFARVPAGDALQLHGVLPGNEGYPWDLDITVVFSLEGGAHGVEHLSVTIDVVNVSDSAAPLSIGWHPYVRLPGMSHISNLSLRIPARARVLTDARLIPLHGDAAFAGINAPARFDYLGQEKLDQSFTDLVPTEDGVVVTSLTNPARGEQVLLTQEPAEAPVTHIFTGDGLPRAPRTSIAVEPCSALPDAFNRADAQARLAVGPGEARSLTATLSYRASH